MSPDALPDLSSRTPIEIDTALAEIHGRLYIAARRVRSLQQDLARSSSTRWTGRQVEQLRDRLAEATEAYDLMQAETAPFDTEYTRRGGWTRAFLVTSSSNGHVHSWTSCSTCLPTTAFTWLPEYSGTPEATIVDDAGERACTSCYSSAPSAVRTRATRIYSPEERSAATQRVERAAAKAARDADREAKAISTPDGAPLRLRAYGVVKTERTAQTIYVDRAAENLAFARGLYPGGYKPASDNDEADTLAALAHKWGVSVEDAQKKLAPKVEARVRRDYT